MRKYDLYTNYLDKLYKHAYNCNLIKDIKREIFRKL